MRLLIQVFTIFFQIVIVGIGLKRKYVFLHIFKPYHILILTQLLCLN